MAAFSIVKHANPQLPKIVPSCAVVCDLNLTKTDQYKNLAQTSPTLVLVGQLLPKTKIEHHVPQIQKSFQKLSKNFAHIVCMPPRDEWPIWQSLESKLSQPNDLQIVRAQSVDLDDRHTLLHTDPACGNFETESNYLQGHGRDVIAVGSSGLSFSPQTVPLMTRTATKAFVSPSKYQVACNASFQNVIQLSWNPTQFGSSQVANVLL